MHPITLSKVVFSSASRCSGRRGRPPRSSSPERRNLINMICASSCAFYSPEGDSKTEGECLSPIRVGVSFLVSGTHTPPNTRPAAWCYSLESFVAPSLYFVFLFSLYCHLLKKKHDNFKNGGNKKSESRSTISCSRLARERCNNARHDGILSPSGGGPRLPPNGSG